MNAMTPNILGTSQIDQLASNPAESQGFSAGTAGADQQPFNHVLGDMLGGENTGFSQPQGATEPQTMTEEGDLPSTQDTQELPAFSDQLDSAAIQQKSGLAALISAEQNTPTADKPAIPSPDAAMGGKSLPLSGNPLPSKVSGAEQQAILSMTKGDSTDRLATVNVRGLESEFDDFQSMQQKFDRSLEGKFGRESINERLESARFQNEFSIRERTQLQNPAFQLTQLAGAGSNMTDSSSAVLLGLANQATSSSQAGSTAAVTPIFDAGADPQNTSEARSVTGRAEPVLREQLTTPYGNLRWHAEFAGKLRLMSHANVSSVELNLNPAELGAIDIKIHSLDDGTIINFFTSNANTKEVIDASLPRLRELLADSGIQLHHGDVSDRNPQTDQSGSEAHRTLAIETIEAIESPEELNDFHGYGNPRHGNVSMIDHYV